MQEMQKMQGVRKVRIPEPAPAAEPPARARAWLLWGSFLAILGTARGRKSQEFCHKIRERRGEHARWHRWKFPWSPLPVHDRSPKARTRERGEAPTTGRAVLKSVPMSSPANQALWQF